MSNNLALKITADIADAQAKLAVLNAEFRSTQAQINALARAGAAGSLDPAGEQQLRSLTQRALELQSAARPLAVSVNEAGFAVKGLGAAALSAGQEVGASHGQIATATREFRALFDELSSGRTRYTPGTLAILAQRVFGLSGATLAAVGGVAGLAAGLVYLAYSAAQASDAIDKVHIQSLMAGNDITREQFQALIEQLTQLPGISQSSATDIVTSLSRLHMPLDAFSASARLAAEEMRATGGKATEAGEAMAKALDPNRSAAQVAKDIAGLSEAQKAEAKAADDSGDSNKILAEKIALLSGQLTHARTSVGEYSRTWGEALKTALAWIGGSQAGMTGDQIRTEVISKQAKAWNENASAIKATTAALAAQAGQRTDESIKKQLEWQKQLQEAKHQASEDEVEIARRELAENERYFDELVAADAKAEDERTRAAIEDGQVRLANAHQMVEQTDQLLRQELQREKELDRQRQQQYGAMVRGIESAEAGFIRSIISGRQSLSQSLTNLAQRLAENEIIAMAKSVTQRLLLQQAGAAQERAISATTGSKTVMADAAKAFSGTYASVAQIPYVGWILAPAAAAAAYAAVAAYEGLASFDVGTMNVPRDMVARIHAGEMIIPASYAEGIRRSGGAPGVGGATHNYGGIGTLNVGYPGIHEMVKNPRGTRAVLSAAATAYRRGYRG